MIESVLYVLCILLADFLAAKWLIPLGFGLVVPAGVFAIAPIFTLRDVIHRRYGYKFIVFLVLLASVVSYLFSISIGNPLLGRVTIASVLAFVFSELLDTIVYHHLRKETWLYRVIKSNLVSSLADSLIFISLSFGFILPLILGQYVVKMFISSVVGVYLNSLRSNVLE